MTDEQENIDNNVDAPNAWCPLPWSHVSIKANGTFRVCCHSAASESRGTLVNENNIPLHIDSASFEEVFNNTAMKSIRKQMLKGEWPEPCVRCQREFDSGMISRNHYERGALADIMEKENLYFRSHEEAAKFISTIWDEIPSWWASKAKVRKMLQKQFANSDPWFWAWVKALIAL
jgi:hypothetical protein